MALPNQLLRVAFMGTPEFSVAALRALVASDHEVVCVYSQPPRPKGRGQQVQKSPVQEYAESRNIPVFTPTSLKTPEAQARFAAHKADIAVVVAYGLILPKPVLAAPKYGCLNIHASLLPRWRGASPIQQAIWKGDSETGVTIMQMDEGLDTGPILLKETLPITAQTTTASLHDDLSALGARMIVQALDTLVKDGVLESEKQDNAQTTYAPLLKKEDGKINWDQTAVEIDRRVRALNPWPGVWCLQGDERLKILGVEVTNNKFDQRPGHILDRDGHIVCGGGTVLKILKLQPANAKPMDFTSALNGSYVKMEEILL
jgi:methionyl-tRNA formyltransferase